VHYVTTTTTTTTTTIIIIIIIIIIITLPPNFCYYMDELATKALCHPNAHPHFLPCSIFRLHDIFPKPLFSLLSCTCTIVWETISRMLSLLILKNTYTPYSVIY
jgi:hypothetical protein